MYVPKSRPPVVRTRPDPLAAQLSDLFAVVLACETFERTHPLTVATIRSMAPRSPRS